MNKTELSYIQKLFDKDGRIVNIEVSKKPTKVKTILKGAIKIPTTTLTITILDMGETNGK